MLSHLSTKFDLGPERQTHEPRAALFLNRFTRTLTVMYATSGIEQIIGISGEAMKGESFYFCIAENCLSDAVRVLESAKGNDSIAYLRFQFCDPRTRRHAEEAMTSESEDDEMTDITNSDDDDYGDTSESGMDDHNPSDSRGTESRNMSRPSGDHWDSEEPSRTSSHGNGDSGHSAENGHTGHREHSARGSSVSTATSSSRSEDIDGPIELEAVVSCTSDGLVVCLRRARPLLPDIMPIANPTAQYNGIYAAPWASQPLFHPAPQHYPPYPLGAQHPAMAQQQAAPSIQYQNAFMQSIRDVAVFAWALTGINGSLADYARGTPVGESQPPKGLPVWQPLPDPTKTSRPSATPSGYVSGSSSSASNDRYGFGDPGLR